MDVEQMHERQKNIRNFSIVAHIDHGKSLFTSILCTCTKYDYSFVHVMAIIHIVIPSSQDVHLNSS